MVKISRPCPRFSSVRFRIVPDTPIMNGWNRRGRVRVKTRPRRPRSRARGGRGARPPPGAESRLPSPPITAFPFESRAAAAGPPRGDPRPAAGAGCCRVACTSTCGSNGRYHCTFCLTMPGAKWHVVHSPRDTPS